MENRMFPVPDGENSLWEVLKDACERVIDRFRLHSVVFVH